MEFYTAIHYRKPILPLYRQGYPSWYPYYRHYLNQDLIFQ